MLLLLNSSVPGGRHWGGQFLLCWFSLVFRQHFVLASQWDLLSDSSPVSLMVWAQCLFLPLPQGWNYDLFPPSISISLLPVPEVWFLQRSVISIALEREGRRIWVGFDIFSLGLLSQPPRPCTTLKTSSRLLLCLQPIVVGSSEVCGEESDSKCSSLVFWVPETHTLAY